MAPSQQQAFRAPPGVGFEEKTMNFQELILSLTKYWSDYGCVVLQPY